MTAGGRSHPPIRAASQEDLLRQLPDAVLVLADQECLYLNQAAADLMGATSPTELIGKPLGSQLEPQSIEPVRSHVVSHRDSGASGWGRFEGNLVLVGGRKVRVDLRFAPIEWRGRTAMQYVIRELPLESSADAERAGLALGEAAGELAHDLKNALMLITASGERLLRELPPEDPRSDRARGLAEAADRARSLLRRLLGRAPGDPPQPREVDPNALVQELVQTLRSAFGDRFTLDVRANATGAVRAEAGRLERVLLNLVLNAYDAMADRPGKITIETADLMLQPGHPLLSDELRSGSYVEVRVSDDGKGMDPETLAQIFDPFFTTKEPGQGSGLGLASARHSIRARGGELLAYSRPGRGSTLRILLPRARGARAGLVSRQGRPQGADR